MERADEAGTLDLSLPEKLDITVVKNLHAEIKAALDKGDAISLNGSQVAHIDTAALQVLAAMFIYAEGNQGRLELRLPSEAVVRGAALLGMDDYIGIKKSKIN